MPATGSPRLFYGWVVVAAAFLMNVAASPTNAVAFSFFVTPMSDDLGWSRGELSLALLFRLGVGGAISPFLGMAIDRFGARLLGTLAGLTAGLAVVALAFVQDIWQLYALFALSGMSGFGGPAGQLLTMVPVGKWFVAQRGRALAIATIGMPLGTALFIPLLQAVIGEFGWRAGWAVAGALVLLLSAPACALLMRKDPESMGLHPDGANLDYAPSTSLQARDVPATESDWSVRQVLREPAFWTILVSVGLSGLVIQGALVYRTSYWESSGLSASTVALGTTIDPLTVVVSGLLFGFFSERVATRYIGLLGGIGVGLSMLPLVLASGQVWPLFAHNLLWGASMGANITVNNVIWPEYFGRRLLGTIRGMVFPVAVGTAAISTPFFALLLDVMPEQRLVWLVPLTVFVLAGCLIFVARPPRQPRPEEAAPATVLATPAR